MSTSSLARTLLPSVALPTMVALLAGCSGAGAPSAAPPAAATSAQRVSGSLQIGVSSITPSANSRLAAERSPDYVSTGTKHAALFIDGATTAAGSTTSCTSSSCTISWSATLNVPASHTFAVEVDDAGTHPSLQGNTPYVLAEGSGSYAIVAGSGNSLAKLELNGVAGTFTLATGSCTSSSCSSTIGIVDYDFDFITYSGSSYTTPGEGQAPTTGQVFDNDGGGSSPVVAQADSNTGIVTGTTSSPYTTYSSSASTLTIVGVNSTGSYPITVACAPGIDGKFGIKVSGGATPSGDITSAELSGLSPAVSYGIGGTPSPAGDIENAYSCTNGSISTPGAASGSLPVN